MVLTQAWGTSVVLMVAVCSAVPASGAEATLEVLNQKNREVRTFKFGDAAFSVDVSFVRGWTRCDAMPLKAMMMDAVPGVRADLFCRSTSGEVANISCVAVNSPAWATANATYFRLFGQGAKVGPNSIEATSGVDLSLSCVVP